MIRVLEVAEGGNRAVVNTAGLYRVVLEPSGKIIAELVDAEVAEDMCQSVLNCNRNGAKRARAISYADVLRQ